ncbi:DUF6911 family protein [Marinomonas sp. TW1]|uniref:DUF6911 family protein n=1 Tax=Marinomonas sp. TW1 TaxID=1561203 RepID=UPI0007AF327F|nr:hypothetical protein [Marinomonas sp. TW1]KZN12192.1 hypothetical protein OA79_17575 [Marinomonas sp. TW1]
MIEFCLSSSLLESKSVYTPQFQDVTGVLSKLQGEDCTVSLSIPDSPDVGADFLQVRADSGNFFVSMNYHLNEDDEEVRTLFFKEKKGLPQIEILGDYWDPQLVTDDLDLVIRIFKEFYETGNVSQDILSDVWR